MYISNLNNKKVRKTKKINASLVPTVLETTNRGERAYDIYSRLLKERIIIIHEEISFGLAGLIIAQLLFLEKENPKADITLYINTPGGNVSEGLAIIDVMNSLSCDVVTVGMGVCASMGSLLLAAGTKGKRYGLPSLEVMIHQPLIGGMDTSQQTDVMIRANHLTKTRKTLEKMMEQYTGQTLDKINNDMERDFFMNSKEAKEYGIIDHVLCKMKRKNAWKPIVFGGDL